MLTRRALLAAGAAGIAVLALPAFPARTETARITVHDDGGEPIEWYGNLVRSGQRARRYSDGAVEIEDYREY